MRIFVTTLVILLTKSILPGQYIADLSARSSYGRTSIYLTNSSYADLDVEIRENALYDDFTIGFTDDPRKADVIISSRVEGSWEPYISNSSYADLSVRVRERASYEDITIEIKTSGRVDYLIYNDEEYLNLEELVVALLPIINAELDEEDRLEDIPIYLQESSQPLINLDQLNSSSLGEIIVQSQIEEDFEGWEGETIFRLYNGQIWQQTGYEYHYHYAYMPEVVIYELSGYYFMKVEDVDEVIQVHRLR